MTVIGRISTSDIREEIEEHGIPLDISGELPQKLYDTFDEWNGKGNIYYERESEKTEQT